MDGTADSELPSISESHIARLPQVTLADCWLRTIERNFFNVISFILSGPNHPFCIYTFMILEQIKKKNKLG